METADMVKVAVSAAPYSIDKPYSYLVPDALAAAAVPGVRVMVPFGRGNKESEGLILARVQEPKLPGSKAIRQILDPEPVLDKAGIDLALWMRGRYFCTVFEAVKTILPAGLWYGLREIWSLAMEPETPAPPPWASPARGRCWTCWKSRAARRISASCGTSWATGRKNPSRP